MGLPTSSGASAHPHRFRGRFETKLDPKGRLSLPSTYRPTPNSETSAAHSTEQVASRISDRSSATSFIVTNSRFRNRSCLHVYTVHEWEKLERKISRLSALNADVQAFSRFYLSGGQAVELDAQGRFSIPQSLRRFAGLEAQVMLVGLGDKFEIWSQEEWDSIYSELSEAFEDTLTAVASAMDALPDLPGEDLGLDSGSGSGFGAASGVISEAISGRAIEEAVSSASPNAPSREKRLGETKDKSHARSTGKSQGKSQGGSKSKKNSGDR